MSYYIKKTKMFFILKIYNENFDYIQKIIVLIYYLS